MRVLREVQVASCELRVVTVTSFPAKKSTALHLRFFSDQVLAANNYNSVSSHLLGLHLSPISQTSTHSIQR